MMLTAKLNRDLSFYHEHMFMPTPLGQTLRARITSGGGLSMLDWKTALSHSSRADDTAEGM